MPLPIAGAALRKADLVDLAIGLVSAPSVRKSAIPKPMASRSKSLREI